MKYLVSAARCGEYVGIETVVTAYKDVNNFYVNRAGAGFA